MDNNISREEAINYLWEVGNLTYLLDRTQLEMYKAIQNNSEQKFIINCSRRLGKSFMLCVIAVEQAIKKDNCRVCYAAPSAKAVRNIIQPIMNQLLKDCPKELKPKWRASEVKYVFPNGSTIDIAGADAERAENLRGTSMDLGVVDEAGFIDQLDYVVSDILMPQTMTTEGRILIASTPPKSPDHDFCQYVESAKQIGNYMHKTIHDNARIAPRLIKKFMKETMTAEEREKYTEEDLNTFLKEKSGPKNTTWRREYMAEVVKDETSAIIPEFTDEKEVKLVKVIDRPPFFDNYVAMDVGFEDNTAVLFAYWHFNEAKLVIEDELLINRMTTLDLANNIKAKEEFLWNDAPVFSRVSDTDLIVINDLQKLHGLVFSTVQKDNKEAAVNNARLMVANNQIVIHPRCKKLIAQLKSGVWDKSGKSFQRSNVHGHYDLIDALLYMIRSLRRHKNPYPPGYQLDENTMYVPSDAFKPKVSKELIKIFPPRVRK